MSLTVCDCGVVSSATGTASCSSCYAFWCSDACATAHVCTPDPYRSFLAAQTQSAELSRDEVHDFSRWFSRTIAGKLLRHHQRLSQSLIRGLFKLPCGNAALLVLVETVLQTDPPARFDASRVLVLLERFQERFLSATGTRLPARCYLPLSTWPFDPEETTEVAYMGAIDRLRIRNPSEVCGVVGTNTTLGISITPAEHVRSAYLNSTGSSFFCSGFTVIPPSEAPAFAVYRDFDLGRMYRGRDKFAVVRAEVGPKQLLIAFELTAAVKISFTQYAELIDTVSVGIL